MKIKAITKYHLHPPEWLKLQRLKETHIGEDVEQLEFLHITNKSV
jgi:hypothetical protein